MIIDATKIKYFNDPDRSGFDSKARNRRRSVKKKEQVGVILDATLSKKKARAIQ